MTGRVEGGEGDPGTGERRISVVVCTDGRADSLGETLGSLEQLDHRSFEVVVVTGPTADGTDAVLDRWAGTIKRGRCPKRNLSAARNIGIALAAGELVAFIDDDAVCDPGWLDALDAAFDDPEVAAAGGPTFDHTGAQVQAWRCVVDRLGNAAYETDPGPDIAGALCSPTSDVVPYPIGTNACFRRDALVEVGGFDEVIAFYLDESDVSRRLVDAGWVVRPLDRGIVHHRFLPSVVRDRPDVVRDHFEILLSKIYFALRHGSARLAFASVCEDITRFVEQKRGEVRRAAEMGLVPEGSEVKFERDVDVASSAALDAFLRPPATRPAATFADPPEFAAFPTRRAAGRRLHVCLLTTEYPPERVNGIGRVVHLLATGLADAGHVVRVLLPTDGHRRVDLEDGVWVHRVPVGEHEPPAGPDAPEVQRSAWDRSASLLEELHRIDAQRGVDVVQAPNWDSPGAAALLDGRWPVVVAAYTPLATLVRVDPGFAEAAARGDADLEALLGMERFGYERAAGILACGEAIVAEVEGSYGVELDRGALGLVPHGMRDVGTVEGVGGVPGGVRFERAAGDGPVVLFVGRLEARKGVDVLLAAVPAVLEAHPGTRFWIVGDDEVATPGGEAFRHRFESEGGPGVGQVRFTGPVGDEALREAYAACDVVVVPSRFESFGLPLVEAMAAGKPVVASAVGGIGEVVADGATGILVPAEDVGALAAALGTLLGDEERRYEMGQAGRRRFEQRFSQEAMVAAAEAYYQGLVARHGIDHPR